MNIRINILKFIKLFLFSILIEIILKDIYIICFVIIGILLFKESSNYDDHQILDITQSFFNFNIII